MARQACSQDASRRGEYLSDQIINFGLIGFVSAEDARFLGGPGACFPEKIVKFEIFKLLEMK